MRQDIAKRIAMAAATSQLAFIAHLRLRLHSEKRAQFYSKSIP
jgi:hypothetical protein